MLYKGHWSFPEDVNLIRPHFKDFRRTDFGTFAATSAFVRVDGDIPIAGAVPKTIICDHVLSNLKGSLIRKAPTSITNNQISNTK
jgi:hypothetical protein